MTPLELMAAATWDGANRDGYYPSWARLAPEAKADQIATMRAALLALAEAELPEQVSKQGRETLLAYGNGSDEMFRAMCRAIAEGRG